MYLGRRRSRGGHLGLGVPDEAGNVKGPLALALGALVKPEKRQLLNNSLGNIFHADLMVQISKIHILSLHVYAQFILGGAATCSEGFVKCFPRVPRLLGCTAAAMLPKQARGTIIKHITKPSVQVAAPPSAMIIVTNSLL